MLAVQRREDGIRRRGGDGKIVSIPLLFIEELILAFQDTADLCRLIFPQVRPHHYGVYTLMAENEVGRALTSATLLPISYGQRTYSPMVADYHDYPSSE